jgi:hypothetical protein
MSRLSTENALQATTAARLAAVADMGAESMAAPAAFLILLFRGLWRDAHGRFTRTGNSGEGPRLYKEHHRPRRLKPTLHRVQPEARHGASPIRAMHRLSECP